MALFKNKTMPDPITDRARVLTRQIKAIKAQIKSLKQAPIHSSTAVSSNFHRPSPALDLREPIFEETNAARFQSEPEATSSPDHFNSLGVRKYDLVGALRRGWNLFIGPSVSNPKLVNYLAAGSIHGLRPLRYEKRVARTRFIILAVVFLATLWGVFAMLFSHR